MGGLAAGAVVRAGLEPNMPPLLGGGDDDLELELPPIHELAADIILTCSRHFCYLFINCY